MGRLESRIENAEEKLMKSPADEMVTIRVVTVKTSVDASGERHESVIPSVYDESVPFEDTGNGTLMRVLEPIA